MTKQLFFGLCLSITLGLGCNESNIEGGECTPGERGCDPGGPGPGGPGGPERVVQVGPGTGTDFDPKGDGSGGVKTDKDGNIILDPGNRMGGQTPIIWVANSAEGTVSKIDTRTLKEVARYVTYPGGGADPSRTTVSLNGDVVVANRCLQNCDAGPNKASALKIAGDLSGCIDRNGDKTITTSNGSAPLPWAAGMKDSPDECVLWLTDLSHGGTQTLPRAAAFDSGLGELGTSVYIGLFNAQTVVRLDGSTGKIVGNEISVAPAHPYGIVLDKDGAVWVQGANELMRVDVKGGNALKNFGNSECAYGIAADARGNIYTSGSTCVARLTPSTGKWDRTDVPGSTFLRGIALDQKNQVWTSDTQNGMYKLDAAGAAMTVQGSVTVAGGGIGAAIDFDNNPWIISQTTSTAYKVNPANLTAQSVKVGNGPYTYSDMTGFQLRNAGAPAGIYRKTIPGCGEYTRWFDLSWMISAPIGSEVTVRVRFAATQADLQNAMWVQIAKLPPVVSKATLVVPPGVRPDFMQVEFGMKSADIAITPILSSLSVGYSCNVIG